MPRLPRSVPILWDSKSWEMEGCSHSSTGQGNQPTKASDIDEKSDETVNKRVIYTPRTAEV
jgi:hypothetical protein